MNHELVHVVRATWKPRMTSDGAGSFGKVDASSATPKRCSKLPAPRLTASRWNAEGGAVFLRRDGGGLGRARGYDEMVRPGDGPTTSFLRPARLSRGSRVDFQSGANAYLYGTRFFTWLAYVYSPEKVLAWLRRDEGSEAYYSDQFLKVFGLPL